MKKLFTVLLILFISSILFNSCNKDNPVSSPPVPNPVKTTITYKKTTPPVNINIGGNTYDNLTVGDTGSVSSLSYNLDSILSVDVTKIDVLLSHNGTVDTLIHNLINPGNNFIGTVLSDNALGGIQSGSGNYSGTYKPYKPLSVFNGTLISGQWQLIVNYWGTEKTGVIKSWGITVTYNRASSGNNVFPFAVGNKWIYRDSAYTGVIKYDTLDIPGTLNLHGVETYLWKWKNSNTTYYIRGESDGIYDYGNSADTTYSPNLWVKYPVNQNDTYLSRHWLSYYGIDSIMCTSTNTTFAGFTDCLSYSDHTTYLSSLFGNAFNQYLIDNNLGDSPNTSLFANYYFKPGIGYIGADIYSSGSFLVRFYVVQYSLN